MNIKQFAQYFELTAVTIRHYEKIGLLTPSRNNNGYRIYDEQNFQQMTFIINAKRVGFSLSEIQQLLDLSKSGQSSVAVKTIVSDKINEITIKIKLLEQLKQQLDQLNKRCDGQQPIQDCPILNAFYQHGA